MSTILRLPNFFISLSISLTSNLNLFNLFPISICFYCLFVPRRGADPRKNYRRQRWRIACFYLILRPSLRAAPAKQIAQIIAKINAIVLVFKGYFNFLIKLFTNSLTDIPRLSATSRTLFAELIGSRRPTIIVGSLYFSRRPRPGYLYLCSSLLFSII